MALCWNVFTELLPSSALIKSVTISILSPIITSIHLSVVLFNGAIVLKSSSPLYEGSTVQHTSGIFGMETRNSIV
jgi:hypothetical protein